MMMIAAGGAEITAHIQPAIGANVKPEPPNAVHSGPCPVHDLCMNGG
jgi:hypothetical protein